MLCTKSRQATNLDGLIDEDNSAAIHRNTAGFGRRRHTVQFPLLDRLMGAMGATYHFATLSQQAWVHGCQDQGFTKSRHQPDEPQSRYRNSLGAALY